MWPFRLRINFRACRYAASVEDLVTLSFLFCNRLPRESFLLSESLTNTPKKNELKRTKVSDIFELKYWNSGLGNKEPFFYFLPNKAGKEIPKLEKPKGKVPGKGLCEADRLANRQRVMIMALSHLRTLYTLMTKSALKAGGKKKTRTSFIVYVPSADRTLSGA